MKGGKFLLELLLGGGFALVALAAIAAQISQTRAAQVGLRASAIAGFEADRARARVLTGDDPAPRPPWQVEEQRAPSGDLVERRLRVRRAQSPHFVERRVFLREAE